MPSDSPPHNINQKLYLSKTQSFKPTSEPSQGVVKYLTSCEYITDSLFPGAADSVPPLFPFPTFPMQLQSNTRSIRLKRGFMFPPSPAAECLKIHAPICCFLPGDNSIIFTSSYSQGQGATAPGPF